MIEQKIRKIPSKLVWKVSHRKESELIKKTAVKEKMGLLEPPSIKKCEGSPATSP